ncbi:mannosyl-3-phosphoglycerate phosphatase-related protein [Pantoea sp. A4]|uniref:mannosyl-3-phosphoglycerate phosphatase-related protein n=1 Tax=Pantoea sp. A4 TaxID=1225184 RepID=UPI000364E009|nr:mannosyl-3-phosphoglycerate phosphatase-related protein [Pantoea sp. A4]
MIDRQHPLLIVTDLDGSLLDHHSYRWDAAQPWLERLRQQLIPLVICSSKTAAEIVPLQKQLGLSGSPFIAENGAVLQLNSEQRLQPNSTSPSYSALCQQITHLQAQFHFTPFHQLSDVEVSAVSGLTLAQAELARRREASEVLIWRDSEDAFAAFRQQLAAQNLSLLQGGRFWHILPADCSKQAALAQLLTTLCATAGGKLTTIGLGDGPNDASMLDSVDYAVVIKGYSKQPVELHRTDKDNIYFTAHYGPEGWSEGMDYFLTPDT